MQSLDRVAPIGVLAACVGLLGYAASRRPFWFDEIFTAYIAAQPTVAKMWGASRAGFDLTPPLFHLITRAAAALGWAPELTLRIPGLIGFAVMAACVFIFVRRRCGLAPSLAAMLLPMGALAARYAVEARPYGLVLGLCGIALVCWQSAVDGRRRRAALFGLAMAIAAAVSLHYYALIILLPIGAGELARLIQTRRADWGLWAAVAAGVAALAANLMLSGFSKAALQNAWMPAPEWRHLLQFYSNATGPVAWVGMVAGAIAASRKKPSGFCAHEIAAAVSLAGAGVVVFAAGLAITGMFISRYALPAEIGLSIMLAWLLTTHDRLARVVTAALAVMFIVNIVGAFTTKVSAGAPPLLQGRGNVVCGSSLRFLPMAYYGADMRYLADPEQARRFAGTAEAPERELVALRRWAAIRVDDYAAFASRREPFLLYWVSWPDLWIVPKLREDGATLRLLREEMNEDGMLERLYSVEWR